MNNVSLINICRFFPFVAISMRLEMPPHKWKHTHTHKFSPHNRIELKFVLEAMRQKRAHKTVRMCIETPTNRKNIMLMICSVLRKIDRAKQRKRREKTEKRKTFAEKCNAWSCFYNAIDSCNDDAQVLKRSDERQHKRITPSIFLSSRFELTKI